MPILADENRGWLQYSIMAEARWRALRISDTQEVREGQEEYGLLTGIEAIITCQIQYVRVHVSAAPGIDKEQVQFLVSHRCL
jgi:hypothetical protein